MIVMDTPAARFFDETCKLMGMLAGRWQDEQKYEDIADYAKPLVVVAERHGVTEIKMMKQPFGCTFKADGKLYRIKVKARSIEYQQIG